MKHITTRDITGCSLLTRRKNVTTYPIKQHLQVAKDYNIRTQIRVPYCNIGLVYLSVPYLHVVLVLIYQALRVIT